MSKTDQQLRLATGRVLAYDEHGEADGAPIFYFHGSPTDFQRTFIALIKEGLRSGSQGAQLDSALMASPWDFRPQEIQVAVHLWHGEVDANAPLAMGQYLAKNIPNCRASFYPGEGHLSLMAKHVEEILNVLAA